MEEIFRVAEVADSNEPIAQLVVKDDLSMVLRTPDGKEVAVDLSGTGGGGGGGGAVTVADGADVTEGATTDALVAAGGAGTVSAKLRRISADIATLLTQTDGIEGSLTSIDGGTPAALGQAVMASSMPVAISSNQSAIPGSMADGSDVALGTTTDAAIVTSANGTVSGKLRGIVSLLAAALKIGGSVASDAPVTDNPLLGGGRASTAVPGAVSADGDSVADWRTRTGAEVVDGGVASGATDSGSPVKTGGRYNSTKPTFTDGQRGDAQLTSRGAAMSSLYVADSNVAITSNAASTDSVGAASQGLSVIGHQYQYDVTGTDWDRVRNNADTTVLTSAARTADTNSADQTNFNWRGMHLRINVSAGSGFSVVPNIQGKESISSTYYTILQGVAITSTGITILKVYPGIVAAANAAASDIMPRVWRLFQDHADATSVTYSVDAAMVS